MKPVNMNILGDVSNTDNTEFELPTITGDESPQEMLDYMLLVLCRRLQTPKAFKDGYLLNQLLNEKSRMTHDVDFSISDGQGYEQVKSILTDIAECFKSAGLIMSYNVKPTITSTSSGGIDFYDGTGAKILGVDVGLHSLTWGITKYNFKITDLDGFSIERMLSDKTIAILSRKRFRRTKDLYDFWVITNNFDFDYQKLQDYIDLRGGADWDNIPFSDTILIEYAKAWNKLVLQTPNGGVLQKPDFATVLERFYYVALSIKGNENHTMWSHIKLQFI